LDSKEPKGITSAPVKTFAAPSPQLRRDRTKIDEVAEKSPQQQLR
jgi:hypothetical protein